MLTESDLLTIQVDPLVRTQAANTAQYLIAHESGRGVLPVPILLTRLLVELVWRQILHQYSVPFKVSADQHIGGTSIGGRKCQVHTLHVDQRLSGNKILTSSINLPIEHPALKRGVNQRIEIFSRIHNYDGQKADKDKLESAQNCWVLPQPLSTKGRTYQVPCCVRVLSNEDCVIEIFGFDKNNLPVSEELICVAKIMSISSTYFFSITCIVCKNKPPSLTIFLGDKEPKRFMPSAFTNLWHSAVSVSFLGFIHSDQLQAKLAKRLESDTDYRIRWYAEHIHSLSLVELNPLPKLFALARSLDQD
mgnify:CR=1 FL=1